MEKIKIGKVVSAVGLKGEVKIYSYAERLDRFERLKHVVIGETPLAVQHVRYKGNTVILKVDGIADRNAAEAFRNQMVFMNAADLEELPEGEYYIRDLIGAVVQDLQGNILGELSEIATDTAQDLYHIRTPEGKCMLLPGVALFVRKIDLERHIITVTLPDGLAEL